MALQICTYCGYEGKGKADPDRGDGGFGALAKFAGMLTMIPFHTIWKMFRGKGGKICPNCGLPGMVKLASDEGFLAQRKFEVVATGARRHETRLPEKEEPAAAKPGSEPRKKPVDPEQW